MHACVKPAHHHATPTCVSRPRLVLRSAESLLADGRCQKALRPQRSWRALSKPLNARPHRTWDIVASSLSRQQHGGCITRLEASRFPRSCAELPSARGQLSERGLHTWWALKLGQQCQNWRDNPAQLTRPEFCSAAAKGNKRCSSWRAHAGQCAMPC